DLRHRRRRPGPRRGPRLLRGPRLRGPRGGAPPPRGAAGPQLRAGRAGHADQAWDGPGHRADGERRHLAGGGARRRLDGGVGGREALGPFRAHHRRDRGWTGRAHAALRAARAFLKKGLSAVAEYAIPRRLLITSDLRRPSVAGKSITWLRSER